MNSSGPSTDSWGTPSGTAETAVVPQLSAGSAPGFLRVGVIAPILSYSSCYSSRIFFFVIREEIDGRQVLTRVMGKGSSSG